ncbi:MAG: DUF3306 domain-containing protein [Rhodospirillales bacterium]|nr:DUF3306 domain-containing protein [Rhodospirillales bacterium]
MRNFFSRWSKRAVDARRSEPTAALSDETTADQAASPPTGGDPEDTDLAKPADLPDVEELGPEADYRPFLERSVAPALRRLALRRLWQSDPVLANLDGLNDYDDDFASLHRSGAEAIADAVRAGRKYARDPIAARDDPETQAADLPADSGAGSATPESEAAAVDADDPEVPEKPA